MIRQISNLNWTGFIAAFLVYFIIGALWFTLFFSKAYKLSLGKSNEELPKGLIFILGPALCTFFITLATAILMAVLDIHTISEAMEFSLIIGLGYLVANTVNIAINPNIPRPILYGIISGAYHLLGIFAAVLILYVMK